MFVGLSAWAGSPAGEIGYEVGDRGGITAGGELFDRRAVAEIWLRRVHEGVHGCRGRVARYRGHDHVQARKQLAAEELPTRDAAVSAALSGAPGSSQRCSCHERMKLTVFRHASYDSPWWAFPSPRAGRFHRGGSDTVQYLSLHPLGPAAEMRRHNLGPTGNPDHVVLNLWTAVVDVDDPTRVDFDDCATYALTADELIGDDYAPTQVLADTVRNSGAGAMIVPSAALPGTHNLILFGVRVLNPFLGDPLAPEEVPSGHLSDAARPPAEVAPHVRWFGAPHAAAEQWKASGSYDLFDDPIATRW